MKIPFLHQTVVALDVRADSVRWVEINRLGKSMSLVGHGHVEREDFSDFNKILEAISGQVTSEAYVLSCCFDDILVDLEVEEIPYFEEQEEIEQWVSGQKNLLENRHDDKTVKVAEHIVEVDEDVRRCIFQIVDQEKVEQYVKVLEEFDTAPVLVSTGLTETGYALIYEDDFISGKSAVLVGISHRGVLCSYQNGLLQDLYEIEHWEANHGAEEADSYLRTVEVSEDLPQYSIPLFMAAGNVAVSTDQPLSRPVRDVSPLQSKTGFTDLKPDFGRVCGLAVKTFFPDLDAFDFSSPKQKKQAYSKAEKKESFRTGVLLFPPLILIVLLLFAIEGFVDVNLTETSQVLEQLSDHIEQVNTKTEQVNQATVSYQQLKKLVDRRRNSASLFELVNDEIPGQIWLQDLQMSSIDERAYSVLVSGYAPRETMIAGFMGNLENNEKVQMVELISSRKVPQEEIDGANTSGGDQMTQFQLRFRALD